MCRMDANGLEARQTNSHDRRVVCRASIIDVAVYLNQLSKIKAGVRVMSKSGTVPFLIHTD